MQNTVSKLRELFEESGLTITPCCHAALSAKLIEQAGFPLAFMSGFGVSAALLGLPDTGQISVSEMIDQAQNISTRKYSYYRRWRYRPRQRSQCKTHGSMLTRAMKARI